MSSEPLPRVLTGFLGLELAFYPQKNLVPGRTITYFFKRLALQRLLMGTRPAKAGSFWRAPRSKKQKNGPGRHWQPDPPGMLLLAKKLVNKYLLGHGGAAGLHA